MNENQIVSQSFFNLGLDEFKGWLKAHELPSFRAAQVFKWVYQKRQYDPISWTDLPQAFRDKLVKHFHFTLPKVVWKGESKDGTVKFLLGLSDGKAIEAVLIPAPDRMTLCLSSQVGCAIGCTFCHTGTQGLTRNLQAGEIVTQYLLAEQWLVATDRPVKKITNMVYMGQGEPLHNFQNVKKATEIFLDPKAIALGQRRITLSTSGLVPQIEKLFDFPPINFAISLHAARNDVRSELMPINRAYDLDRLLTAIKKIPLKAHRHITYEYILIKGLNDGPEDIVALTQLLPKGTSKINLIPFNEYPESRFKRPSLDEIDRFCRELNEHGLTTTVRTTKGQDILAACGQLKSAWEKGPNVWPLTQNQNGQTQSPAISI